MGVRACAERQVLTEGKIEVCTPWEMVYGCEAWGGQADGRWERYRGEAKGEGRRERKGSADGGRVHVVDEHYVERRQVNVSVRETAVAAADGLYGHR